MSTKLQSLLGHFQAVESVELAAVVAIDGLLIESISQTSIDVDAVCAVASNSLAMAENLGREVAKGQPIQTLLEYSNGLVIIEPIGDEAMLLILTGVRDDLGYLRFLAAKHRREMAAALSAI